MLLNFYRTYPLSKNLGLHPRFATTIDSVQVVYQYLWKLWATVHNCAIKPSSVSLILGFCTPSGVSRVVCGTHCRLIASWAMRLFSQWKLNWWRVNGSTARETFPWHPPINREHGVGKGRKYCSGVMQWWDCSSLVSASLRGQTSRWFLCYRSLLYKNNLTSILQKFTLSHGCGAGTKIAGSGSGHLNCFSGSCSNN